MYLFIFFFIFFLYIYIIDIGYIDVRNIYLIFFINNKKLNKIQM